LATIEIALSVIHGISAISGSGAPHIKPKALWKICLPRTVHLQLNINVVGMERITGWRCVYAIRKQLFDASPLSDL
jgi:hypothetical protein